MHRVFGLSNFNLEFEQNLVQNSTFEARNFRTMLIYRMLEVHILNRVQNCTRLVLHTNCTRQSRTGRTQMPFEHKEKTLLLNQLQCFAVFCRILLWSAWCRIFYTQLSWFVAFYLSCPYSWPRIAHGMISSIFHDLPCGCDRGLCPGRWLSVLFHTAKIAVFIGSDTIFDVKNRDFWFDYFN